MNFQPKKKKKIWLPIFAIITAGAAAVIVFLIFFNRSVDFKRVQVNTGGVYEKKALQHYQLERFRVNNENYAYSRPEGATLKGNLLTLADEEKTVDISPQLKGKYLVHIQCLVLLNKKDTLSLSLRHKNKEIATKRFDRKGFFALDQELVLTKGDGVTISAKGKGVILVGNPVFYKPIPPEERSLVFLVCADTLRADHLPTYGYHRDTAPNVQAFSKDSAVFMNAYAQAPWTLPSHMSLFTSLNEYNHGVKKEGVLADDIDVLVEALSRSFVTRSFNGGVWVRGIFGFYRGFDFYRSRARYGIKFDSARFLFEDVMEDLEGNSFPRSFYFLHSYQIHAPYKPRREFLEHFNPKPRYKKMHLPLIPGFKKMYEKDPEKFKKDIKDYYDGCVRSFDHQFGLVIDYLKKKKLYDNAMIIFLSDHGEEFHDHKNWGHNHTLYNELIRVPLIIKFPGNKFKGTIVQSEAGLIDVMPTVLNWYHIPFETKKVDGMDLLPLMKGKQVKRLMISSITSGNYSLKTAFKLALIENNNKIICHIPYKKVKTSTLSAKTFEFYDLLKDPAETLNLYLKQMPRVKRFRDLFDHIIQKGFLQFTKKGKKVFIDEKMKQNLKTLGYL